MSSLPSYRDYHPRRVADVLRPTGGGHDLRLRFPGKPHLGHPRNGNCGGLHLRPGEPPELHPRPGHLYLQRRRATDEQGSGVGVVRGQPRLHLGPGRVVAAAAYQHHAGHGNGGHGHNGPYLRPRRAAPRAGPAATARLPGHGHLGDQRRPSTSVRLSLSGVAAGDQILAASTQTSGTSITAPAGYAPLSCSLDVSVNPGSHEVRVRLWGWLRSKPLTVKVDPGATVRIEADIPRSVPVVRRLLRAYLRPRSFLELR
jgi:hypothetical protein